MESLPFRILLFGDAHIHTRARQLEAQILKKFEDLLQNTEIPLKYVFYTGDIDTSQKFHELLTDFFQAQKIQFVRGNMDFKMPFKIPESHQLVLVFGNKGKRDSTELRLAITHGDQVHPRGDVYGLTHLAKELKADALITGHTHCDMCELSDEQRILLLNPGSVTGAWSVIATGLMSFQTLTFLNFDERGLQIRVDTFVLMGDSLEIKRSEFIFRESKFLQTR